MSEAAMIVEKIGIIIPLKNGNFSESHAVCEI
jgi:hypothetical protein